MQVPAVDVDGCLLLRHGMNDRRVRMPDDRYVVVHVDIAPPVPVEQVDTLASHDLERRIVEKLGTGPERKVPTTLQGFYCHIWNYESSPAAFPG